jgi:phosphoribosylamine---glycine ligase
MKILVIDVEQMGLDFALRCADAGHDVKLYRHMPKRRERYGEGFKRIRLADDWQAEMPWAKEGLVVNTGNFSLLTQLDRYREVGYNIFGPSAASAKIEIDRMAGMKLAEACGLAVPEYHVFGSLEETEAFARKQDRGFVFKPAGDEENKALTYVASDPADLVGWLRRQVKAGKQMKQCLLQEKVEVLSELGVSAWVGLDGFLTDKFGLSVEHKKLMDGEHGPSTGEMGTCCIYEEEEKLADEMLLPLEPTLRALGHRGDFSIGCIVDTAGKAWFLEVTARCGYPAWWIQTASHRGDPANWMLDLLKGKDSLRVSYDAAIGVVCAQPPFPYGHDVPRDMVEGNPIAGVDDFPDQVHLASVMRAKGPVWRDGKIVEEQTYETTGPYVLVCTGLGKTIERARQKVYRAVDGVRFADKMYRDDIGVKVTDCLPKLHKFGYGKSLVA